jgi:methylated-DNA-[protein]-cysteine S-methyltransferase
MCLAAALEYPGHARLNSKKDKTMQPATLFDYFESPIGTVEIGVLTECVTILEFVDHPVRTAAHESPVLHVAMEQVKAYFEGRLKVFDLPLDMAGTPFQQSVWQALLEVPFGHTASYQQIADAVGNPNAVRAVGAANGQNPVSIIVPCHRIIGKNGGLTGYGGGIWRKEWLLRHEGVLL